MRNDPNYSLQGFDSLLKYPWRQPQIRPLNLKAGELVKYVAVKGFNGMSGKKGFILRKTQERSPHRTDVYLVKFQHEDPCEVDERWLQRIFTDDEDDADERSV